MKNSIWSLDATTSARNWLSTSRAFSMALNRSTGGNKSRRISSASRVGHLSLVRAGNALFAMIPHPVSLGRLLRGKGAVKRFLADVGAALRESYDGRGQSYSN